jgi:hypothetical protein
MPREPPRVTECTVTQKGPRKTTKTSTEAAEKTNPGCRTLFREAWTERGAPRVTDHGAERDRTLRRESWTERGAPRPLFRKDPGQRNTRTTQRRLRRHHRSTQTGPRVAEQNQSRRKKLRAHLRITQT